MPRPITFDPDRVLQIAAQVFYEQGFADTGVADIVTKAGVSRHSLYARWGDKDGLFAACLPVYRAVVLQTVLAPLDLRRGHRGVRDLLAGLAGGCQAQPMPACLLVQSLIEQAPQSGVASLAKDHFDQVARQCAACIEVGQARGDVDPDFDARAFGELVSLTLQGLNVSRRVGLDVDQTRAAIGILDKLLQQQERT